jgi:ABC-type multidrug transport system fused ATPase/permease subunit
MLVIGVLGALVSGCVWPFFNYIFSAILPLMLHPIESEEEINRYCLYMLLIAIASGLLTIVYSFAFGMASERLMFRVRIDLFNKLLRLPVSFYDRKDNTAGAISSKLATDVFQIRNMVSGVLGVICLNSSTIISSLLFGMYYSWKVTLIAIALSPLIAVVGQVGSVNLKATMNSASKSQQSEKFLGSLMSDSVCNIRTVKSMGYP